MVTSLDWYGCATFRSAHRRPDRLPRRLHRPRARRRRHRPRPPTTSTQCDWIVVGHSHFDHLYGAERIARNTGATIVGSYETVRVMEQAGVPLDRMICVAGGETVALSDDVPWRRTRASTPACGRTGPDDAGRRGLPRRPRRHLAGAAGALRELVAHLAGLGDARASTCRRRPGRPRRRRRARLPLRHARRALLYQDTSGHWSGILHDLRPDVAILAAAGRGNVDGEPIQGSLAAVRGPPGRAAAAPPRRALPPRRLAARLLGGHRRGADPRRARHASRPAPTWSSSATSTAHRSCPGDRVAKPTGRQAAARYAGGPTRKGQRATVTPTVGVAARRGPGVWPRAIRATPDSVSVLLERGPEREREQEHAEGDVEEDERVLEGTEIADSDVPVVQDADQATDRVRADPCRRLRSATLAEAPVADDAGDGEEGPGHRDHPLLHEPAGNDGSPTV